MSTSVPFYYQPVNYNNELYIDGGILDNYPIQEGDKNKSRGYSPLNSIRRDSKDSKFKISYFSMPKTRSVDIALKISLVPSNKSFDSI